MSVTIKDLGLDLRLSEITRDDLLDLPRLKKLRDLHFNTRPEICLELARLTTNYLKKFDVPEDSPELRAGRMYKYILKNKEAHIHDDNLLLGTTTTKKKGVVLYPDVLGTVSIWPELETITRRSKNPYNIGPDAIRELNEEIFPYWMDRTLMELTRKRYSNPWGQQVMERAVFFLATKVDMITHTIPNYAVLMNRGLQAVMDEAWEKERSCGNGEKGDFYRAVRLSLEGVLDYAQRLSDYAADRAQRENDLHRKKELEKMSDACRRVPAYKPANFQQAVNSLWIYHVALHQENVNIGLSPGRLDQVLYPAFEAELESRWQAGGPEGARNFLREAVELVGCLWLKMMDHVVAYTESVEEFIGGTGCNQAVTLGGVCADGEDAVNDLTYVILRVTELLRLRDPNLNARYHPDIDTDENDEYLRRLCEVNIMTGATPCFHNDKSVIKNLKGLHMGQGRPEAAALRHARDYGIVGCVEPESCGRTFGHHGAIMLILPSILELALFQGKHRLTGDEQISKRITPDPRDMRSFADFQKAFQTQLQWLIDQAVSVNNMLGKIYQEYHPFPLVSALTEGCMAQGQDVITGGALYNSSGAWVVGLAEVVDSLTAIQEFVFEAQGPKQVSFDRLIEAINKNWEEHRYLQALIKKSPHKFGTDSDMAQKNAEWLIKLLHDTFQGKSNYRGGKYTVGYYTMTTHAGFGKISGALPSGRKAGDPFPSGITPVSGAAPELPAVLEFLAKLDYSYITNGQALNLKFSPGPATALNYASYIKGFFQSGGLQLQSNIIDREELLKAQAEPDKYPELFVRVSGYSAYFRDLNPMMQQEIITRQEYDMK